ncbi:MAG TPA: YbjN domain-containing protein [Hyphomonadaceae bacterium]
MSLRVVGISALMALVFSVVINWPAAAQLMDPATPEQIAEQLRAGGFEAEVHPPTNSSGPGITSRAAEGVNFDISFDACNDEGKRCQVMVFSAGFAFEDPDKRPSKADLNRWNLNEFGKAVANANGDPWLDLEVNLVGGITRTNLIDTMKWWNGLVGDFAAHIGWDAETRAVAAGRSTEAGLFGDTGR